MKIRYFAIIACLTLTLLAGCDKKTPSPQNPRAKAPPPRQKTKGELLADAAAKQVGKTVTYDPTYVGLAYPGGDVPIDRGVCTDVVIRALRKFDVDLQLLIHEDMKSSFDSYPNLWNLKKPDPNIDHRRVPNIAAFLQRKNKALPLTRIATDYLPGDIVVWRFPDGRPHIGIVSNAPSTTKGRHKIVHNAGAGAQIQDVLFAWEITGHFRWF